MRWAHISPILWYCFDLYSILSLAQCRVIDHCYWIHRQRGVYSHVSHLTGLATVRMLFIGAGGCTSINTHAGVFFSSLVTGVKQVKSESNPYTNQLKDMGP